MKRFVIMLIVVLTSCIEKPDIDPVSVLEMKDLTVPDGFNYEVSSLKTAQWKVNDLPEGTHLKAQMYLDDQLQFDGSISEAVSETPAIIPLHNEQVKMVLFIEGERLVKTFDQHESLIFEADYTTREISSSANNGNGNNQDTDGDGVKDNIDLEPQNPLVTQAIYIPALESYNTIGFEDTWPNNGDYDYNDLVVTFNLNKYMNKSNKLSRVETNFRLLAVGAGYDNDFCYTVGVPLDKVTVSVSDPNLNYELHGNSEYTEVRFPSVKNAFGTTDFVNTVEGDAFYEWLLFTVTIEVDATENVVGTSLPYDFFIRIDGEEGREVHMAGKHPTGKVNRAYFGSGDDNSQPANGKLYLNDHNLPWAVMIPSLWEYPSEKVEILQAYPDFAEFAQNNAFFPWYSEFHGGRIVRSKVYKRGN